MEIEKVKEDFVMAQYEMSIRYAGESLENGRMPIKDLAPALLAISGALQEIQRIKEPGQPTISVDVKATKKGSFVIDLILANGSDVFTKALDLFTCKESEAFLNLVGYSSLLIGLMKIIKYKAKKEEKLDNGNTKITFEDGKSITLNDSDLKVYTSVEFRTQIKRVVTPLDEDGIDSLELYSEKTEMITINKEETSLFDVPDVKEKVIDPVINEIYLQLLNVAFEHGKWKFSDGSNQFFATIEDADFMESVSKGNQQFSTNDRLKVRMRTVQKVTINGLKSEIFIEKILEHIPGAIQLELDF